MTSFRSSGRSSQRSALHPSQPSSQRQPEPSSRASTPRSRTLLAWALALGTALLPALTTPLTQAQGTDAQALRSRALAATCAQCHGTDGKAVSGAVVPGLAGLPAPYFSEQMTAFKAGTRPATVMHQLAKGYSDAQIAELAAYFAGVGK